jgi:hypothetical protein
MIASLRVGPEMARLLRCQASATSYGLSRFGPPPRVRAISGPTRSQQVLLEALKQLGLLMYAGTSAIPS